MKKRSQKKETLKIHRHRGAQHLSGFIPKREFKKSWPINKLKPIEFSQKEDTLFGDLTQ